VTYIKKRVPFATTIDMDIQRQFKTRCAECDLKMNETLETLMKLFIKKEKDADINILLYPAISDKTK